jgi:hypothetical protein
MARGHRALPPAVALIALGLLLGSGCASARHRQAAAPVQADAAVDTPTKIAQSTADAVAKGSKTVWNAGKSGVQAIGRSGRRLLNGGSETHRIAIGDPLGDAPETEIADAPAARKPRAEPDPADDADPAAATSVAISSSGNRPTQPVPGDADVEHNLPTLDVDAILAEKSGSSTKK